MVALRGRRSRPVDAMALLAMAMTHCHPLCSRVGSSCASVPRARASWLGQGPDIMCDLANELAGATALLESLTAAGEDVDTTLKKLFSSFASRIQRLPPCSGPAATALATALEAGPWTDRQREGLLAMLEASAAHKVVAPKKGYQHCLRHGAKIQSSSWRSNE